MTLLESLVAVVILGLVAVGFLGVFQQTARSTYSAHEWVQAVGLAETTMEQTKLGTGTSSTFVDSLPAGFARRIDVQPWPVVRGIERVTVTITLPGGGTFALQRLVRAP
ncbi:MAG: type IV pilus modification PilV family protein [Longimicrobiales bacterium]